MDVRYVTPSPALQLRQIKRIHFRVHGRRALR